MMSKLMGAATTPAAAKVHSKESKREEGFAETLQQSQDGLALLMVPSTPPPQADGPLAIKVGGEDLPPTLAEEPSPASTIEVDVDLSALEAPSSYLRGALTSGQRWATPLPGEEAPSSTVDFLSSRGLNDLTAAELASGFEMAWQSPPSRAMASAGSLTSVPPTMVSAVPPSPVAPDEATIEPRPDPRSTLVTGTPRHPSPPSPEPEVAEPAQSHDTAPAPHRASLQAPPPDRLRDPGPIGPRIQGQRAIEDSPAEGAIDNAEQLVDAILEGAELEAAPEPTTRAFTPKAMAVADLAPPTARIAAPRVQPASHSAALADEQLQRQDAAASAVNHMTLRHLAEADIDHPELGRIRVAARNVAGEVDVEMKAKEPGTVAVLQSTSGQLQSELRQASVELRDLDVRADSEAHDEESRPERAPRDQRREDQRGQRRTTISPPDQDAGSEATRSDPAGSGSSVRIVL